VPHTPIAQSRSAQIEKHAAKVEDNSSFLGFPVRGRGVATAATLCDRISSDKTERCAPLSHFLSPE